MTRRLATHPRRIIIVLQIFDESTTIFSIIIHGFTQCSLIARPSVPNHLFNHGVILRLELAGHTNLFNLTIRIANNVLLLALHNSNSLLQTDLF